MNTYNKRLSAIETILNGCITYKLGEYKNVSDINVNRYMILNSNMTSAIYRVLIDNGYESLNTHSNYTYEFFNRETLSNVSYCEGDVYIVLYDTLEQFESKRERTIEFIKEN